MTATASPDLLANSVILVTGAGSGIGAAVAKSYALSGATVILLDKTIAKLEQVYDDIGNGEGKGYYTCLFYSICKPDRGGILLKTCVYCIFF